MLGHRLFQAAAQHRCPRLEPADLALEPVPNLLQLGVPAQLAQDLVELLVGRQEILAGVGELLRAERADFGPAPWPDLDEPSSLDSATSESSVPGERRSVRISSRKCA